jgi:hypothetical protein
VILQLVRATGLLGLLLLATAPVASAATQKEIDQAIKKGTEALKGRYTPGGAAIGTNADYGIGPTALSGLALIEAGVPVTDPAIKNITERVRDASYKQYKTYQIALCLMYLDRLGDPTDVPLIQMLAVRLLVGQTKDGGWNYECCGPIPAADEQRLRQNLTQNQLIAGPPPAGGGKDPPKLHAEVEKYAQALANTKNGPVGPNNPPAPMLSDNSNTQFAVLAVWMARKHGVPVENALDLIEKRFIAHQDLRTGNWSYSPPPANMPAQGAAMRPQGSPAMYCAGLLGMATALARREERQPKNNPAPKTDAPAKPDNKSNDPFYNPPTGGAAPPKPGGARQPDVRDLTVQRAFAGLGMTLADQVRNGKGLLVNTVMHGYGDLYFLWSLERACVIYDIEKLGGVDWYDLGSTAIVRSQSPDGTWGIGSYGAEVNTSFAVLFLCKANLARDLSSKVQKDPTSTEMRAGSGPSATDLLPNRPPMSLSGSGSTSVPASINLSNPTNDASVTLAANLLKATGADWTKLLGEARDGKGTNFTRALVLIAECTDGDRKKEARDALSERLCRMTPATLRTMLKATEAELRRAAALACAMKDDKDHVPDLIDALADADDNVGRAAKAGLKSLTGKDFGPAAGASAAQKAAAVSAWKAWYAKEKK